MAQPASPQKPHHGPSFTVGVALGALVGAGALMFAGGKKVDEAKDKLTKKLGDAVDDLKQKYPQAAEKIETTVAQAQEKIASASTSAKKTADEVKQAVNPGSKPKPSQKTKKNSFTRSGKPLSA